jgi:hypothetical protein
MLLGYPGTGKFTVASEVVRQVRSNGDEVRLIDNHATANLLFDLIEEADGKSRLPADIFDRVREINLTVLRTIDELSPKDWSFVFTHHLVDTDENRAYLKEVKEVAERRGANYLNVVLSCDLGTLVERVVRADRRHRNKLTDPERALEIVEFGQLLPADALKIDVSQLLSADAAKAILARSHEEMSDP